MQTINDEYELPAPLKECGGRFDYIRSKCDPRYLIAGKSGEVYERFDGQPWEWPGYEIGWTKGGEIERTPATAHEDTLQIKPKKKNAA